MKFYVFLLQLGLLPNRVFNRVFFTLILFFFVINSDFVLFAGLVFLIIFGFLFVLQFLCMLVHRFTTLSHFIARAPYRCGQSYRTSISFLSRDLDPDEEHLVAEARNLEPQLLERMIRKPKGGKRKKKQDHHNEKSSERSSLMQNRQMQNHQDVYMGRQNASFQENV
jgi:hypothetical protein